MMERDGGPLVCIGPDGWVREHGSGSGSCANALVCEDVDSSAANALGSYLRMGKRRACVLWARFGVDGGTVKKVERANGRIDGILETLVAADPSTAILVTFQRGYHRAKALSKLRIARRDGRSTLGWSAEQEDDYVSALGVSERCEAFWIGVEWSGVNPGAKETDNGLVTGVQISPER